MGRRYNKNVKTLTHKRLLDVLFYNKNTGHFFWLKRLSKNVPVGRVAGYSRNDGRKKIRIDGVKYYASRLAWFYVNGKWPSGEMDHINGTRSDDRIINLRDVSTKINRQNRHFHDKDSKVCFLGVSLAPSGRYRAQITTNKKITRLGVFDTPEEAYKAYVKAKRVLHEGCTI